MDGMTGVGQRMGQHGGRFVVSGSLRGRRVSVAWHEPPGDPPGARISGDTEVALEVALAIDLGKVVSATPTGPRFAPALDPDYVALVTIVSVLDPAVEVVTRGAPEVPGCEIPEGAVS